MLVWVFVYPPLTGAHAQPVPEQDYLWYDPQKIVGAEPCGECHQAEYEVWKQTKHATGFKTLHRKQSAERISKALGFKLIKRESLCLKCHYLAARKGGQLRATSGVSCESCHGAAEDWIDVHNDYGTGFNFATESAEHKAQRIANSQAQGMFRPSTLYDVAASCFQCHTVPHERLVNVGGHTSGSSDFEFVERAEEIRHNFLQAQFDPARSQNTQPSPERKRMMYLVGRAVELEYNVRGAAAAKEDGRYLRAMQRRVRSAGNKLKAINQRQPLPELEEMLSLLAAAKIESDNEKSLLGLADSIGEATSRLITNHDGSLFAALDALISGGALISLAEDTEESTAETEQPSKTDIAATNDPDAIGYPKKSYIRPRSKHQTIGPSCDCHDVAVEWWQTDTHFYSAQPFKNQEPGNVKIATLYGINPAEMTKGTSICMDCHATVVSGEASEHVFDGVSCESCHGPAGDYLDPHSVDDSPNGYLVGKDVGMRVLSDVKSWANACAQCHYITDARLLSAGHTSGADFDPIVASQSVQHWQQPSDVPAELQAAYERVKQERGPIPDVILATLKHSATATPSERAQTTESQGNRKPDWPTETTKKGSEVTEAKPPTASSEPNADLAKVLRNRNFGRKPIETGYVNAICLNVREGPGATAKIVGHVFKGDPLEVLEVRGGWQRISDVAGYLSGWVAGRYLSDTVVKSDFTIPEHYKGPKTPTIIENNTAKYVGVQACIPCHSEPHAGLALGPYGAWRDHFHSSAFQTLSTSYAKAFANKRGIEDPLVDWRCVKCHVTALGVASERLGPGYNHEEGVGCEACHGPGSDYLDKHYDPGVSQSALADLGFRVFSDLNERDQMCRSCHNELSPTYKPFNVEAFSAAIRHWASEYQIEVTDDTPPQVLVKKLVALSPAIKPQQLTPEPKPLPPQPEPSTGATLGDARLSGLPADWMLGLRGPKRGPVFFPHKDHIEFVGFGQEAEVCVVCHHQIQVGALPGNCSDGACHKFSSTAVIDRKKAFHDNCRTCHREEGAGPQRCQDCHES